MSGRFDWKDEETEQPTPQAAGSSAVARFWMLAVVLLLALITLWLAFRFLSNQAEREAQASIQFALDLARDACRAGDGEVFFSLQSDNAAWEAALLQPELFEPYCAGLRITEVRPYGTDYAAVLEWPDGGASRLGFFSVLPGETRQIPPPAEYWADERVLHRPSWGAVFYGEADEPFAADIAAFVEEQVAQRCAEGACRQTSRPFMLRIRPDHRQTAEPHTLQVASPRLIGLDANGRPAPLFWDALEAELTAHLTPGVIRFAVLPLLQQAIAFDNAAAEFMRQNPDLTVEIVTLNMLPEEADATLAEYDGAAYTPTAAMIAAGLIHDVTDYAATDPDFDPLGFQDPLWRGAHWRGRLWFVPHAGQMRVLYYDKNAYEAMGLAEPADDWTWMELEHDIIALRAVSPARAEGWSGEWSLLDTSRDILYAQAFNHAGCGATSPPCIEPIEQDDVAAALHWYRRLVTEKDMPDLAAAPPADRADLMANWQGVPRRAAIWVDDAVSYEQYLQMWPVGVTPFPDAAGGAPLWTHGSFISSRTARPRDVWRWLAFLSRQSLNRPLRYVPARPEVAEEMQYWETLPGPLRDALRATFPEARPVPLDQRDLFGREQLDALLNGLPPEEAARQGTDLRWFGR